MRSSTELISNQLSGKLLELQTFGAVELVVFTVTSSAMKRSHYHKDP